MTSEWEILLRVALAAVFGGIIGFDRRVRNKPAGIRTHMLVAMGAALAVGVSALVVEETAGAARADAVRVAAGVVTGVGFLGAGGHDEDGALDGRPGKVCPGRRGQGDAADLEAAVARGDLQPGALSGAKSGGRGPGHGAQAPAPDPRRCRQLRDRLPC